MERSIEEGGFIIEEVDDPDVVSRHAQAHEAFRRNSDWLQKHWSDVLPRARGKFLAVAGEQAFIADTPQEAWEHALHAHPGDQGAFSQFVRPERGPRVYANQR